MPTNLFRILAALLLAASAHAADDARKPPTFRLGDAASPTRYEARLAIDPGQTGFSGEIRIDFVFARTTPVLWLHANGLEIESAAFAQGARRFEAKPLVAEPFVGFEAPGEPFAAAPASVTLRYRGKLDALATRGLFRQRQDDAWYVLSQFETTDARRAFPCFDEPGWKVPWQLTIDAPAPLVVVSNTPERSTLAVAGRAGWTRHAFEVTRPLPSYLIALAVGPFDVVDGGVAGAKSTPLRYIVPHGRAEEAAYAKQITPRLVAYLEDYFGAPFPFAKLDSVSIPQTVNFGAMENAGMITYAQTLLLANAHDASAEWRRRYAAVAAHEIAHQWFGDLVTPAWWDDIWLNESFATWMGRKTVIAVDPAWDDGGRRGESRARAIEIDRFAAARSVRNPVANESDIEAAFDGISYNKGGEVLSMFEAWLTPERFRDGVRAYLRRHAEGSATSTDFFRAVGEAAGRREDALRAFAAFVEQPGVPLVSVALQCRGTTGSLRLTQERLRPVGSQAAAERWTTPACFRAGVGKHLGMACAEIENEGRELAFEALHGCPDWASGNAMGVGYYVARYDAELEKRLVARATHLPEAEAAALATDGLLLAESGLLSIDAALDRAAALLEHRSPVVQREAAKLLRGLRADWLDEKQRAHREQVVQQRLLPLARRLSWDERERESDAARQARAEILPIAAELDGNGKLRAQARVLALRWLDDPTSISADLAPPALETSARFADAPTYDRLERALLAATDLRVRAQLLKALGKVRDPKLRERALSLTLDGTDATPRLAGRDALTLVDEALQDDANRRAAFDYVRAHFEPLVAKLPPDTAANFLRPLGHLCTAADHEAFAGFFGERAAKFRSGSPKYRQSLERIELCVAARDAARL